MNTTRHEVVPIFCFICILFFWKSQNNKSTSEILLCLFGFLKFFKLNGDFIVKLGLYGKKNATREPTLIKIKLQRPQESQRLKNCLKIVKSLIF